jgi:hypothetical protein
MAINLGSAYGKVELDSTGVKKGVDSAIKNVQTLQTKMAALGNTMSNIGGKMTFGLTLPLLFFAKSAVAASMEQENALQELNAVLESTKGIAGVTADELTKMAAGLQKVTTFGDEAIISGQSMLLTFTNIGKEVFPQATETMLNLAQKFGSMDQASIMLGKALNDPIAGVTALRRVGIQLSDQQEQQIKNFMAVNDIASAQKVILGELETQFGGLARAMAETSEGKIKQLKNAFGDLKELFGTRLEKAIIPFVESLTKAIEDFLALPEPVKNGIVDMIISIGKLAAVAGPIIFIVGKLLIFASLFMPGGAMAGAGAFISTTLIPSFSTFFTFITATAIPAIAAFVVANAWWIVPLLLVAATVYLVYLAFKNNFMGITTTAKQLWFILKFGFTQLWAALKAGAADGLANLRAAWDAWVEENKATFTGWVTWMRNAWQNILNFFIRTRDYIVQVFQRLNWSQIGKFVVLGIANGILMGIPALIAAGVRAATELMRAFDGKLDIRSPSGEFEKRGIQSWQGYLRGWGQSDPNAMAKAMANPVLNQNSSNQQSNSFHFASGLTIRQAREMMEENNDRMFGRLSERLAGA